MQNIFNVLFLLARPAAGKSEIIHFLQNMDEEKRKSLLHIGKLHVIDDFPMLWSWFEEDDLLENMGYPRLHTDGSGYFLHQYLWDLLIKRMELEYSKFLRDIDDKDNSTVIFEFSRGKEHGGYKSAFSNISDLVLERSAILYVNVSWEESLRKNRKRFNPERPDSILEHSLPDEKLARLYYESDWKDISTQNSMRIQIGNISVPFATFENEDDVTSKNDELELGKRLELVLNELWGRYTIKNCRS
jgi:hypothetical protein